MILCIVDNLLFCYTLVNSQDRNIVLAVNGLVLDQRHIRHGYNGWNGIADGQLGSTAPCLLLVEETVIRNLGQKVRQIGCSFGSFNCSILIGNVICIHK